MTERDDGRAPHAGNVPPAPEPSPAGTSSPAAPEKTRPNSVGHGMLLGFLILLAHIPLMPLLVGFFPGIVQWVVVGPLIFYWRRRGAHESVKGILVMAGLVVLVNAACCGILLAQ